jgi:hypothetical protein
MRPEFFAGAVSGGLRMAMRLTVRFPAKWRAHIHSRKVGGWLRAFNRAPVTHLRGSRNGSAEAALVCAGMTSEEARKLIYGA